MNLSIYNPNSVVDDFFNNWFHGPRNIEKSQMMPKADIVDAGKEYKLYMELPGIKKEDISIEANNGALTIEAKKEMQYKVDEKNSYLQERSFGSYKRSFNIDNSVNTESIEAKYDNGILELTLPKREAAVAKTITVK